MDLRPTDMTALGDNNQDMLQSIWFLLLQALGAYLSFLWKLWENGEREKNIEI